MIPIAPLDVRCWHCMVDADQPCRTSSGTEASKLHKVRRELASDLEELRQAGLPLGRLNELAEDSTPAERRAELRLCKQRQEQQEQEPDPVVKSITDKLYGPEVIDFDRHEDGRLTEEGREQLARWSQERGLPAPRDTSKDTTLVVQNLPGGLPYSGRSFAVRVVQPGESLSDKPDVTWPSNAAEKERAAVGDRLVEVADAEYGAYITSYYASTLLARAHRGALNLKLRVEVWTIDASAMAEVVGFIRSVVESAPAQPTEAVPAFVMPRVVGQRCPGCGGEKLSWNLCKQVSGIEGRLSLADVIIVAMLECDHCSRCIVTQSL